MATYKPLRIGDATRGETTPIRTFAEGDTIDPAFLPGGGGAASIVEITYADMATALAGATLTPGQYYNITDAGGTDLGFVCLAVQADEITASGAGGFTLIGGNEWDICEFDFANNQLVYRSDLRGNVVRGADGVAQFPWGNDNVTGNFVLNGIVNLTINAAATYANNTVYPGATISDITAGDGTTIENNILENGAQLTGITAGANCSISRNKVGQGATLGGSTTMGDGVLLEDNVMESGASLTGITADTNCRIIKNSLGPASSMGFALTGSVFVRNNILDAGALVLSLRMGTGVFGENHLGASAVIAGVTIGGGGFSGNILESGASMGDITTGTSTRVTYNFIGASAVINTISASDNLDLINNILENGAQLTGITAGANCQISRNKVGQGATLGGSTTMGDGAAITDNDIGSNSTHGAHEIGESGQMNSNIIFANGSLYGCILGQGCQINGNLINLNAEISECTLEYSAGQSAVINNNTFQNGIVLTAKTVSPGASFNLNLIGVNMLSPQTISDVIESKESGVTASIFYATINITGLTTLDCLAENNYVGIFNAASSNATETINQIDNAPTAFPIQIRPAAGLVLTVTGTAYAGIAAGQIALTTADVTLDGDKGEYLELEIDPLGTGALIERRRVAGIL